MNYVFIFDRVTGEPIHGMEERPVMRSDREDDQSWPVQPFPLKPGPIGRVGMTRDDINKMTPEIEQYCTEFWDTNNIQPSGPYARAMERKSIVTFPGATGGPNWGPISYNPQLGYIFINLMNNGSYRAAGPLPPGGGGFGVGGGGGGGRAGGAAGEGDAAGPAGRGGGGGRAGGAGRGGAAASPGWCCESGGCACAPGGGQQGRRPGEAAKEADGAVDFRIGFPAEQQSPAMRRRTAHWWRSTSIGVRSHGRRRSGSTNRSLNSAISG